jgi:PII-like signaling protein
MDRDTGVIEDCLTLTAYFGERSRSEGRFLADVLTELYGDHEVASSVVLRGTEGFGAKHHLRTDRTITLSEDLPVVSTAVDTATRIEHLLSQVIDTEPHGLVTLERSRMLRGEIGPTNLPEQPHEATKLSIYVGRRERVYRVPAFVAVCDLLHRRGIAGASVLLGVDGTAHGQRERARFFSRNAEVPTMIVAVVSGERIAAVLPELGALLARPLITVERVRVCKRDGDLLARPHELPGTDERGRPLWQKLTVYTSESSLHDGRPIHRSLIRRLRSSEHARGATALRGIWGFHGDHQPHGDRWLQLRRHVPVTTVVLDTPEHIAASFDVVDELTSEHGLVTSEMVPALATINENGDGSALRLGHHRF